MQDVVDIESELMKNMISSLISKMLKSKKDIIVNFRLDEFHAANNGGKIKVYVNMNVEMSNEDLDKILNKFKIFRTIILGLLNAKFTHKPIERTIKDILKKNIDIKINDLKCSNKNSRAYVCLKANAETTEEKLRIMLVDAKLL